MALNWDAFLNPESLNIPHDQWSDIPPPHTAHHASQMPKSISTHTAGSTPEDLSALDTLLNATSVDPYFDDSLFLSNDYFLSDMEVLQPFANNNVAAGDSTTESSPEPTTALGAQSASQTPASVSSRLNQSPQVSPAQRQALQRANSFPNPAYESMFPNTMDHGFVQDLTFSDRPKGSSRPGLDRTSTSTSTTAKRNRNKPDILSACWTSPLCPNHDQEGSPPNPSTCGGGCAPFLFANEDTLPTPTINNLLAEAQEVIAEDGIVEIQPRPKKRSESDASSNGFSGRQFPSNNNTTATSPTDSRQRMKSETSEDSPAKESPLANEDPKLPKSRRRLPHNQVERKYRESLNTQLDSLRRVVPSLQQNSRACDGADIEDLPTTSKPSKAVILASATAYIKQQEKEKKSLADENQLLRTRVKALQALVKCDDCSLMQYVMDLKLKQAS
ncbi:uncharacterized protein K460DRAFT_271438 [Cucurbitaria berberidis CBS 394.84]|uniref:BHLH domain-containing protein n=1 Tax=Cucurbitaria berberidis CBS 394.84 TaxID=1168544 RepID=A0A9P4GUQ7_9PLEO|nr:uncharacterized protein K460DRAFT_271438 [Cucurbitaria berberidis CBS 394.84]KAF1851381.1 hypothetical protein K460DRAFT_271438 [Cucurbitaria berberidis CBS 394.84]